MRARSGLESFGSRRFNWQTFGLLAVLRGREMRLIENLIIVFIFWFLRLVFEKAERLVPNVFRVKHAFSDRLTRLQTGKGALDHWCEIYLGVESLHGVFVILTVRNLRTRVSKHFVYY